MKARKLVWAALALAVALPLGRSGEEAPRSSLLRLTYINVPADKLGDYNQRLREYWKPVQQDRVARGRITSWKAYAVAWPNGESLDYNYVIAVELPGYAALEQDPTLAENAKKAVGAEKYDHVAANPLGTGVRVDTLVLRLATQSWPTTSPQLLNVAYLRSHPGKAGDLLALERDHFLAMTEDSINAGRMVAWGFAALRFPEHRDNAYTHVSIGGYASLTQLEAPPSEEFRAKWQAGATDATNKLPTLRKRVKGELWRLVEQTTPVAKPAT